MTLTPEQAREIVEFNLVQVAVQYDMDNRDLPAQALGFVRRSGIQRGQQDVLVRFPALAGELMLATLVGYLGYMPGQVVIKADTSTPLRRFVFSHIENLSDVSGA